MDFLFQLASRGADERLYTPLLERELEVPWLALGIVLAVVILAIVLFGIQRTRTARRSRESLDRGLGRVSHEHNLSLRDEKILRNALQQVTLAFPLDALVSQAHFDRYLAPALRRQNGRAAEARLREQLFRRAPAAAPVAEGLLENTRALRPGREIHLRFQGLGGTYQAFVVGSDNRDFVLAIVGTIGRHLGLKVGDRVEGAFDHENALFSFVSRVSEVHTGILCVCCVEHTDRLQVVHRRRSRRVPVDLPVRFNHLRSASASRADMREAITELGGVLRDLSPGGCSIVTDSDRAFAEGDRIKFSCTIRKSSPPLVAQGTLVGIDHGRTGATLLHVRFQSGVSAMRHTVALALLHLYPQKFNRPTPSTPASDADAS